MAKKKESKQKKMNVRVDFTPMVDMMMLLITFFMLCTSLAKPQAMHLTMPANDKNLTDADKDKSKTEQTITIYLTGNDEIYVYMIEHKEDFGNVELLPKQFKATTWGKEGIREILKSHKYAPTKVLMDARTQLQLWYDKQPSSKKELNDSIYDRAMIMIKKGHVDIVHNNELDMAKYNKVDAEMKDPEKIEENMVPTLSVNIKPLDESSYDNLVTILDEMQICCVGKYVIDKIYDRDLQLLESAREAGIIK
jgi:biopolymer transport protein ExbD